MVTSLDELKKIGSAEQELPPFSDGTPFTARLKKVSVIELAGSGKLPNPLMKVVMNVIGGNSNENASANIENELTENTENAEKSIEFMMLVVKNSLVSPTYNQIQECGVSLTDEQIFAIFSYAMGGDMSILSKFR